MNLSRIACLRLSISVTAMVLLFLASGCNNEEPEEPELSLDELLTNTGEELAAMSSVKFEMIDEMESGAKFFGATLKKVEGEVSNPDSVRLLVDVVTGLGFAKIEIVAIGEESYIKFSREAPWTPLPLEQVPFNFVGLGVTLSDLLSVMENATIVGRESMEGARTVRVDGTMVSDELSNLITSVDSGHPIAVSLWIEESEHILRRLRIDGQIFNDDAPGTVRLINLVGVNAPVDIQLPNIASGS